MAWSLPGLSFCVLTLLDFFCLALQVQVRGLSTVDRNSHRKLNARGSRATSLSNFGDIRYYIDISLGNRTFKVQIDTGSSDLWVSGEPQISTDTGLTSGVTYAAGSIQGRIKVAPLVLAGRNVLDQAFLEITPDRRNPEGFGILGLGPGSGSFINKLLPGSSGAPALERIFLQEPTAPNFFTILLGRDRDPTDSYTGSITVGETLSDYNAILNETKLGVTKVPTSTSIDQHLQTLLDPNGIIGPDGKAIKIESSVTQTVNKKQATVVLDSGFTLPQLPRPVIDAIYSRFQGAEYMQVPTIGGAWVLPCSQEVNVTFNFAGREYPIHPLDMTMYPSAIGLRKFTNSREEKTCIGTFQPFTYDRGGSPNYDMVLGMAFMRNVYTLFDYGDFIGNSTDPKAPYIQMLPTTDRAEAHSDFVTVRLGGVDSTFTGVHVSPPRRTMYYVISAVVAAAVMIVVATFAIMRARRRRR